MIAIDAVVAGYTNDLLVRLCLAGLFLILVFPLIVIIGASFFRAPENHGRRSRHYLAIAIVLASPLLTYLVSQIRYQVAFLAWAPFHRDVLSRGADKDGVLLLWDSWGFGWSNTAYLARASGDELKSVAGAKSWGKRLRLSCEIVHAERVWSKLYIIIVSDCGLDDTEIAS
jgi:hypothetical protein